MHIQPAGIASPAIALPILDGHAHVCGGGDPLGQEQRLRLGQGEIAFPETPHRATYTSFDGVIVNAEIVEENGKF